MISSETCKVSVEAVDKKAPSPLTGSRAGKRAAKGLTSRRRTRSMTFCARSMEEDPRTLADVTTPAATSVGPRASIATARSFLNAVLIRIPMMDEVSFSRNALATHVASSLTALYRLGNAECEDVTVFLRSALDDMNEALALLKADIEVSAVAQAGHRMIENAQRVLRKVATDPALAASQSIERRQAFSPALTTRPRLIRGPRPVLPPVVPWFEEEAEEDQDDLDEEIDTHEVQQPSTAEEILARSLGSLAAWHEETKTEDEDAEPPTPRSADVAAELFGTSLDREEVELERAEELFTTIAMMGALRRPNPGDEWWELQSLEERLFANFDGLLSIGTEVIPVLARNATRRPAPDPDLVWAVLFVYGSLVGDDALEQVIRTVSSLDFDADVDLDVDEMDSNEDAEPEIVQAWTTFDAAADALALLPNEGIVSFLRSWLQDLDLHRRRLAVSVLGRRRELEVTELVPALRLRSPVIQQEALIALEQAQGDMDPLDLAPFLAGEDEASFRAAVECSLVRGWTNGVVECRRRVQEGRGNFGRAAVYAALGSAAGFGDELLSAARQDPMPDFCEALGWYGHLDAVDFLIEQLSVGRPVVARAAGEALQRLTGASLTEINPHPTYRASELPFSPKPVGESDSFLPGYHPMEGVAEVSLEPEAWRAWWDRYGSRAERNVRMRWGSPWSTYDNVWELYRAPSSSDQRRLSWLELRMRTSGSLPFDARGFVVDQEAEIAAWVDFLRLRYDPAQRGTWPVRSGSGGR